MESEGQQVKLENNGNCLFCKAPPAAPKQLAFYSVRTLLQYLQMMKVVKRVKCEAEVGLAEPAQLINVDLEGPTVKAALCEGCGDLVKTFSEFNLGFEKMMRSCLASIQNKMKVGKENVGVEYPILEGTIMRQALNRLERSQPSIVSILTSPSEAIPAELPEVVKIEVDEDVERNAAEDPNSCRNGNEKGQGQPKSKMPVIVECQSLEGAIVKQASENCKELPALDGSIQTNKDFQEGNSANSQTAEKMDADSFPEIEATVKYEEDSCPAPQGNEQADVLLQTGSDSIDIKYEFPNPPAPKKKLRGRPPSKKVVPVSNENVQYGGKVKSVTGDSRSNPTISLFYDPMEGLSSTLPQKRKSKQGNVSNAPGCSTNALSQAVTKRSRTVTKQVNASLPQEPSTSGVASPVEDADIYIIDELADSNKASQAELGPSTVEPRDSETFNSTLEEEHNLPNYLLNSTSFFNRHNYMTKDLSKQSEGASLESFLVGDVFVLKSGVAIQRFLTEKEDLPQEENPFPAKSIQIYLSDKVIVSKWIEEEQSSSSSSSDEAEEILEDTAGFLHDLKVFNEHMIANLGKLLEKFGRYIHRLQIKYSRLDIFNRVNSFLTSFPDILRCLPNLQEFELIDICSGCDECNIPHLVYFPPIYPLDLELPLEYLGIAGCSNSTISTALLNRYGHQLRKLVIEPEVIQTDSFHLQPNTFLQLQELTILENLDANFISKIDKCIFPNLVKLTVKWLTAKNTGVLPFLKMFPTIKYFELKLDPHNLHLPSDWEEKNFPEDIQDLPNLHFIVFPVLHNFTYKFLLNFPNLKEIRFLAGNLKGIWNSQPGQKFKLFLDIYEKIASDKMYESNIWDKLLKLEIVKIDRGGGGDGKFNRLEYNRLQQLVFL